VTVRKHHVLTLAAAAMLSNLLAVSAYASDADAVSVRKVISGNASFVIVSVREIVRNDTFPGGLVGVILNKFDRRDIKSIRIFRGGRAVGGREASPRDTIQLNFTSGFLTKIRSRGATGAVTFDHSVDANCSNHPRGRQAFCDTNPSVPAPVTVYIKRR